MTFNPSYDQVPREPYQPQDQYGGTEEWNGPSTPTVSWGSTATALNTEGARQRPWGVSRQEDHDFDKEKSKIS